MAEGAPSKNPKPAKSRPAFDPSSLPTMYPDGEDIFGRGAKVVAPWVDGLRYSATVVRVHQNTVRVIFEDGTPHIVPRAELDLDDGLATYKERDEEAADLRPPKRPKPSLPQTRMSPPAPLPPPPRVAPTSPCAICMSTITVEDAHQLQRGHAFHTECLRDLADHVRLSSATRRSLAVSCPLCRKVTRAEVGADED